MMDVRLIVQIIHLCAVHVCRQGQVETISENIRKDTKSIISGLTIMEENLNLSSLSWKINYCNMANKTSWAEQSHTRDLL